MGKAEIVSGGPQGLYTVKLIFSRDNLTEKIDTLKSKITAYETEIAGMPEGAAKTMAIFKKNILVKRKEYYENTMTEDVDIEAWCADYTEDLTGEVGTIEIPGERGYINIRPGNSATYDQSRDGQLQPSVASKSAAGTFYNLALLPGWQKWMPTYRYGTISSINHENNTCTVTLDSIESSAQNLDVNYVSTLSNISINYMNCHSCAFNEGDNVIVEFSSSSGQTSENWDTGQVIGFKDNPQLCGFYFKLTRGDGTLLTEEGGLMTEWIIKDADGNDAATSTPQYVESNESWFFNISGQVDKRGYHISYNCEDGIETQYPYRYKTADKGNEEDLTLPGLYEDEIPYWKYEYTAGGSIAQIGNVKTKKYTVYSSVPYIITHYATEEDDVYSYIIYELAFFLGNMVEGSNCCFTIDPGEDIAWIYDINPMPGEPQTLPPEWPASEGGWGDSMIQLILHSDKLDHTTIYPAVNYDAEEIENVDSPSTEGIEHIITLTNTTPEHTTREILCGTFTEPPWSILCDLGGTQNATYDAAISGLTWGLKNLTYDY